jgi:hypothetical protein
MNSLEIPLLSGHDLAVRAERIDADNWLDDFAAAPAHVAAALGLATRREGELVMVHSRIPFSHFNMVLRGYTPDATWERVVLQRVPADRWTAHAQGCEIVTECYGMPAPIGDWLRALVGRPGWTHAIRREGGRSDGPIVMARSLYCDEEGWAWLGIDAPVPGVTAT